MKESKMKESKMKEKKECSCGHVKCPQCSSRHEQETVSNMSEDAPRDDTDVEPSWGGGGCPVGGGGFAFAAYGIL